jgi:uncharacterized protein YndB with AHSA1/START domain
VKIETSIEIARPIEDVFEVSATIQHVSRWMLGVVKSNTDQPYVQGTTFTSSYLHNGNEVDIVYLVKDVRAPKFHRVVSLSGPLKVTGTVELSSTTHGTSIRFGFQSHPAKWSTRFIFLVLGNTIKNTVLKKLEDEARALKSHLEGLH